MRWFYVLTMAAPQPGGFEQHTVHGTVDVNEGTTRYEIYQWARSQQPGHMRSGNTIFYTAEPDEVSS